MQTVLVLLMCVFFILECKLSEWVEWRSFWLVPLPQRALEPQYHKSCGLCLLGEGRGGREGRGGDQDWNWSVDPSGHWQKWQMSCDQAPEGTNEGFRMQSSSAPGTVCRMVGGRREGRELPAGVYPAWAGGGCRWIGVPPPCGPPASPLLLLLRLEKP